MQTPLDVTLTATTKGLGIVSDLDKVAAALVMTMLADNMITGAIYMSVTSAKPESSDIDRWTIQSFTKIERRSRAG